MEGKISPDEISSNSKEVARGSFWGLIGNFGIKLTSFIYVILIARFASAQDVGTFYLALSISTIASIFSEFGILGALSRYVPFFEGLNQHRMVRDLLNFSYLSVILASIVAIVFYFQADMIGRVYQNPSLSDAIRVFSALFFLNGILKVTMSFLLGKRDMQSRQILDNLQNFSKLILTLFFFHLFGPSVFSLSLAYVLSYAPSVLLSGFFMKKHISTSYCEGEPLPIRQLIFEILPFGFMLSVLISFYLVITSTDRILIGYLIPSESAPQQLAIYSITTSLANVLLLFPTATGSIFLPVISRLFAKSDHSGINSLMETSQRWTVFLSLPVTVVFIVFSKELLSLFYGSAYEAGSLSLSIFAFGVGLQAFSHTISMFLAAARKVDLELKIMGSAAVINFILNLLLIPIWGIEGASLASALCFLISSILLFHYAQRSFGFTVSSESYKISLSAIVAGTAIFFLKSPVLLLFSNLLSFDLGEYQLFYAKFFLNLLFIGGLTILSFLFFIPCALALRCFKKEDVILVNIILSKAFIPQNLIKQIEKLLLTGTS